MKFSLTTLPKTALALVALLSISAFSGCNKSNTQSFTTKEKKEPVIEFRRTACYGTCPIYMATITRSGKITYTGERFTDLIGTYEATMPEGQVTNLLGEVDKADFWQRDSVYVTGATDFPSMILRVRNNGKYKTVRTEGEGPKEIELLMQRVDNAILNALKAEGKPVQK